MTKQKMATNGPVKLADPTASPKQQVANATAINARNAAAKVTKVAAAPALHATEKAPHTRRAVQESKTADRLATASARLTNAKAQVASTSKIAGASKRNDPQRVAKFTAKIQAELESVAARKALAAMSPTAPKAAPKAVKTVKAPRVATNRTIKAGAVKYANAKGGWTLYMVTLTLKHKEADSATAAHKAGAAKAGQSTTKPLDFKWMDAKGYIKLG